MTARKPETDRTGTASNLDSLCPVGGWPSAPAGPRTEPEEIAAWLRGECHKANRTDTSPNPHPDDLSFEIYQHGLLLLRHLRSNKTSRKNSEERKSASKIQELALALTRELRELDNWAALLPPVNNAGFIKDRPGARLDNYGTVFNLVWQDWGRDAHPLELLARLAADYDVKLAKRKGSGNLYRHTRGDPRLVLAKAALLLLKRVFGPDGAPVSINGRAHEYAGRVWDYATGTDSNEANLIHYLGQAARQTSPAAIARRFC